MNQVNIFAALTLCLLVVKRVTAFGPAKKPHVMFILVDDLGHAELGYNREVPTKEVQTPNIDGLVQEGIKLDRHYVHKFCSPTRCAIQSGRAPIHVNVINAAPEVSNPLDPVAGYAGMARNMTGIAEVMKRGGYKTHFAGKWDVGMATGEHTPVGRGYDTTLHYYHHANDYYTFTDGTRCNGSLVVDLWNMADGVDPAGAPYGRAAKHYVNAPGCTEKTQKPADNATCVFEDELFEERVTETIQHHDPATPLFMFWSTHIVHGPLMVPDDYLAKFSFIDDHVRKTYHSMVNWVDGAIGRVIDVVKAKAMYDDMLIVFSSDNGGPLTDGGNNYPMRGGKFSNWEGGIRVAAFASGGVIPAIKRGTVETGLMAGWDWYATFAGLAGQDPTDAKAAEANLPPIDSLDLWPLLSGTNATSPRGELQIGSNQGGDEANRTSGVTVVGGLIIPPYKILVGDGPGNILDMAGWPGTQQPNNTGYIQFSNITQVCGRTVETGCLYDVYADPNEYNNIIASKQEVWETMLARIDEVQKGVWSPVRGTTDPRACEAAIANGGFWGPFIDS